jgi:hypothetical protein
MNSLHPVFLDHAWVASTGPITAFNTAVTTALQLSLPSLVVAGPPGVGKTTASYDLFDALASENKVVPWRASAVDIKTRRDTPRFYRSFQRAAHARSLNSMRLPVLSEQENAVNSIVLSCEEAKTQRVVLFIDEAQQLEYETLVSLKDTMERLAVRRLQLLVLLLGEPDIRLKAGQLMSQPGGSSLVHRFFASTHEYHGLKAGDLVLLMKHIDHAHWPENGGPTYTEYFAPKLYRQGWRLYTQAPLLWSEFESQAGGMGLDASALEVMPRFAVRAIRFILSELHREAGQANDMRVLVGRAVSNSGFARAQEVNSIQPATAKRRRR